MQGYTMTASEPQRPTKGVVSTSSFNFGMGVFVVFVCFPMLLGLTSFVFGCLLAWAEDWKVKDGFYYIVGNLCGLATPITNLTPDSSEGKVVDVFVALVSVSISASVITMVGYFSIWRTLMSSFEGAIHTRLSKGGLKYSPPGCETSASDGDSVRTIATLQRENALLRGLLDAKEGHESNSLGPLANQPEGTEQMEVPCERVNVRAFKRQCAWVQRGAAQRSTVQRGMVPCCAVPCSAIRCGVVRC